MSDPKRILIVLDELEPMHILGTPFTKTDLVDITHVKSGSDALDAFDAAMERNEPFDMLIIFIEAQYGESRFDELDGEMDRYPGHLTWSRMGLNLLRVIRKRLGTTLPTTHILTTKRRSDFLSGNSVYGALVAQYPWIQSEAWVWEIPHDPMQLEHLACKQLGIPSTAPRPMHGDLDNDVLEAMIRPPST
jgi:hypothetical protein